MKKTPVTKADIDAHLDTAGIPDPEAYYSDRGRKPAIVRVSFVAK